MTEQGETETDFAGILFGLRDHLIGSRTGQDMEALENLRVTFATLREVSYRVGNAALTRVVVALEDAARDSLMKVDWKSDIPSEAAIIAAISVPRKRS